MIYTSYFANLKKLPKDIIPIAISASVPNSINILQYKKLAPTYNILSNYKNNNNIELYTKEYSEQILNKLNPLDVINELYSLSNGKDVALICYEKYDKFCHRQLVAEWLNSNVKEYK